MSPTIFDCIAGSRTHTRTHDSWVSQCNLVSLLVPYHVRTDVFRTRPSAPSCCYGLPFIHVSLHRDGFCVLLSEYTSMLCSSRWYLILFFSYGFPSVIAPVFSTPAFSAPPNESTKFYDFDTYNHSFNNHV